MSHIIAYLNTCSINMLKLVIQQTNHSHWPFRFSIWWRVPWQLSNSHHVTRPSTALLLQQSCAGFLSCSIAYFSLTPGTILIPGMLSRLVRPVLSSASRLSSHAPKSTAAAPQVEIGRPSQEVFDRENKYGAHNYHPLPVALAKGKGKNSFCCQTVKIRMCVKFYDHIHGYCFCFPLLILCIQQTIGVTLYGFSVRGQPHRIDKVDNGMT